MENNSDQQLTNSFTKKYLANLLIGNRLKCSEFTKEYLAKNNSIIELYEEVFKVALYEVGKLWETNKITVATEHMATAITEGILNELFEKIISKKRYNKKVVLACVENEQHQVGIKMIADVFEMNGWESFFLGTGIPIGELTKYIKDVDPDVIAISLSIYFNYKNFTNTIELLIKTFPDKQFIVGGQAFEHIKDKAFSDDKKVILFPDAYLLDQYIKSININQ